MKIIQTKPVWQQIEEVVGEIPGWSPLDELYTLFLLVHITGNMDGDILEVGSWCGRSSVVLGLAAQLGIIKTKVYSVDLFPKKDDWSQNKDGSWSFEVKASNGKTLDAYKVQTVWSDPFEQAIRPVYERWNGILDAWHEFIDKNGLEDINTPFVGNSDMFFECAPDDLKLRVVFLDGDHGYEAVKQDILNVEKYIVSGGYVCFDDAFSGFYPDVDRAIQEFIIESGKYDIVQQMTRKFFVARKK
jgi:hypothetical protein